MSVNTEQNSPGCVCVCFLAHQNVMICHGLDSLWVGAPPQTLCVDLQEAGTVCCKLSARTTKCVQTAVYVLFQLIQRVSAFHVHFFHMIHTPVVSANVYHHQKKKYIHFYTLLHRQGRKSRFYDFVIWTCPILFLFCLDISATMPLSTQSQADDEQYVLVASLDNARNLSNILKAITFKDHAIFSATPNGLKVTVEDSKCLQANAFIQVCLLCFK